MLAAGISALLTLALIWLGISVSMKRPTTQRLRVRYAFAFAVVGAATIGVTLWQAYQASATQRRLEEAIQQSNSGIGQLQQIARQPIEVKIPPIEIKQPTVPRAVLPIFPLGDTGPAIATDLGQANTWLPVEPNYVAELRWNEMADVRAVANIVVRYVGAGMADEPQTYRVRVANMTDRTATTSGPFKVGHESREFNLELPSLRDPKKYRLEAMASAEHASISIKGTILLSYTK